LFLPVSDHVHLHMIALTTCTWQMLQNFTCASLQHLDYDAIHGATAIIDHNATFQS
jgi:hypothetical protein